MTDRANATHPATAAKLQQARRDGVVPRSAALTSAVHLTLCIGVLWTVLYAFPIDLTQSTRDLWSGDATGFADTGSFVADIRTWLLSAAKLLGTLGVGIVTAGVMANYIQTGPMFCPGRLGGGRHGKRNAGEWFSWLTLARLVLGIVKIVVVVIVAGAFLWSRRDQIFVAANWPVDQMVDAWAAVYLQTSLVSAASLTVVAVFDFGVIWLAFQSRMKMTDAEVREEQRQQEGDPSLRRNRSQRHRQIAGVGRAEWNDLVDQRFPNG